MSIKTGCTVERATQIDVAPCRGESIVRLVLSTR